jgi:hypothetical protein
LPAPLDSLIEFLGIDEDLVEVEASASAPLQALPSPNELASLVRSLQRFHGENAVAANQAERYLPEG